MNKRLQAATAQADLVRAFLVGCRIREPMRAHCVRVSYTFTETLAYSEKVGGEKHTRSFEWVNHIFTTADISVAGNVAKRLESMTPWALKLLLTELGYLLSEYESLVDFVRERTDFDEDSEEMQQNVKSYSSKLSRIKVSVHEVVLVGYPNLERAE